MVSTNTSKCHSVCVLRRWAILCFSFFSLFASSQSGETAEAQSSFRFRAKPEFMILRLYEGNQIIGHTASLWQVGYTSFLLGKILRDGAIEISFFLPSAEEKIHRAIRERDRSSWCPGFVENSCYLKVYRQVLAEIGIKPFQKSAFRYDVKNGWLIEKTTAPVTYSNFTLEKNYDLGNVEAAALGHPTAPAKSIHPIYELPVQYVSLPVDDLFELDIAHESAGLPPQQVAFKTQYCDKISENLEGLLSKAGDWDVKIAPERDKSFDVRLKSHSSREFFYKDGYWWKAFVEIIFREDNGDGKCSQAAVYLYDSIVCGGPKEDDPDKSGRSQCFQRIAPDSKAEIDLREHLSQILQQSFGAPKFR